MLVLTASPLIKVWACRDARGVTGDGMEVRDGCGYIARDDERLPTDENVFGADRVREDGRKIRDTSGG